MVLCVEVDAELRRPGLTHTPAHSSVRWIWGVQGLGSESRAVLLCPWCEGVYLGGITEGGLIWACQSGYGCVPEIGCECVCVCVV